MRPSFQIMTNLRSLFEIFILCKRTLQLRNSCQVMIVVLGDEEGQVNDTYLHLKARVPRGLLNERFVVLVQPADKLYSLPAKGGKDCLDCLRVVMRLVRPAIRHVGGAERLAPGLEIVE